MDANLYLSQEQSYGDQRFAIFEIMPLIWESRFSLGLNAVKSSDYIEKFFNQKLAKIKFLTKNSVDAYFYLPQEWS